jgi:hypothetical protein
MRGRSGFRVAVLILCALWAHDAARKSGGPTPIAGTPGDDIIQPGGSNIRSR